MTSEQLKKSILLLAVQGKLVPQDPNDEPASVLLERIRKEKEKLIKEGKIKKEKNPSYIFRGEDNLPYEKVGKNEPVCIADEVPFEIPDSWEWVRLSTLSSVITKGTTPRGGNVAYLDSGIGFLRAENVAGFDYLDTNNMNFIDEVTHNGYLKRSVLEPNDILITIAGTLGRTAIVKKEHLPLNANQAVSIVRLIDATKFDIYFIICALNSPIIQKRLTVQKKITAIPNLTLEIISDCIIPVPPLAEQHKIVEAYLQFIPYFSDYETTENQLQALNLEFPDRLKKSILQQAVMGKLVPQDSNDEPASILLERIRAEKDALIKAGKLKKDKHESIIYRRDNSHYEMYGGVEQCIDDEIPFDLPDNWAWCRLSDLAVFIGGFAYKSNDFIGKSGYQVLRLGNIKNDYLRLEQKPVYISEELAKSTINFMCQKQDVLLTMTGTRGKRDYFFTVKIGDEKNLFINQRVGCLRPFCASLSDWLINILKSEFVLSQVFKNETGTANQGNIGAENILHILIPLPPQNEQYRIISRLDSCFHASKAFKSF